MKNGKKMVVPMLFALGSLLFLVPAVVKPLIKGEPFEVAYLVIAMAFFVIAVVFLAAGVGRNASGGSDPASAAIPDSEWRKSDA
jgi:hypothetical protein